jgi:hypothetical protein
MSPTACTWPGQGLWIQWCFSNQLERGTLNDFSLLQGAVAQCVPVWIYGLPDPLVFCRWQRARNLDPGFRALFVPIMLPWALRGGAVGWGDRRTFLVNPSVKMCLLRVTSQTLERRGQSLPSWHQPSLHWRLLHVPKVMPASAASRVSPQKPMVPFSNMSTSPDLPAFPACSLLDQIPPWHDRQ